MEEFGAEHLALEVGKLPKLMLIGVDALLLHEEADNRRGAAIRARIEADGFIRHPLMAAKDHGEVSHLLLDGVNRYEALRKLGCRFVPIQEVNLDDKALGLSTWHHELEGLAPEDVVNILSSSMRVVAFEGGFTQAGDFIPHYEKDWGCVVVLPDRRCLAVIVDGTTQQRVEAIRRIARHLSPTGAMDRVSYTNLNDLVANYPRFSALICYPPFSKSDVLHMAVEKVLFPSGVTRFSVPKRMLSFGIPLPLLRSEGSLEEARGALHEMIVDKIRKRRIRFYEEPTFHFDD
ncbi:MAG: hypothetical protein NTW97_01040 [Candidatus Krumholzibacteria bacterium]|nr:hypothetical protein [Candidatus Krumholzibacteria bacterium]